MKNANVKPAPALAAPAPAPGLGGGQNPPAPTLDQIMAEGRARGRRMTGDGLYLGDMIEALFQEIVTREKTIADLRAELAAVKDGGGLEAAPES